MLQAKRINDNMVAVSFTAPAIQLRKPGKEAFGTEKLLVKVESDRVVIYDDVAEEFGLSVVHE